MDFFSNLETKDLVTLIGIIFTLIIGLFNLFVSSHKNHVDVITQNRIEWVKSVRVMTNQIISWRYNGSLNVLLGNINMLILHLNVSNEIDDRIITKLLEMYDSAYKLSFYDDLYAENAKKLYMDYYSCKQNINTLMRIYLKKEWTRIKAESRIFRIPFRMYWIPFYGFSERWATRSLMKKYNKIKTYEFSPWINFTNDEIEDLSNVFNTNEYQRPTEFEESAYRKKQLRDALLHSNDVIVVPDGKLAGGFVSEENNEDTKKSIQIPDGKLG